MESYTITQAGVSSELVISYLRPMDTGEYSCNVTVGIVGLLTFSYFLFLLQSCYRTKSGYTSTITTYLFPHWSATHISFKHSAGGLDESRKSVSLVVQSRPDPPRRLRVECHNLEAALEWDDGEPNNSPITEYRIEQLVHYNASSTRAQQVHNSHYWMI